MTMKTNRPIICRMPRIPFFCIAVLQCMSAIVLPLKTTSREHRRRSFAPVLFALLAVCILLPAVAMADSQPLNLVASGTVSGGLYVGAFSPNTNGATITQQFSIPTFTDVQWARLEVSGYAGSTTAAFPGWFNVSYDANSDGTYESIVGTTHVNAVGEGSRDGTVNSAAINADRCTSDYRVWYDVTNLITTQNPTVKVVTAKDTVAGGYYNIKELALVVAYNDGDSDQVKYWVNTGQYFVSSGDTGITTIDTTSVPVGFTEATITDAALASSDATYTFNGNSKASGTPASYFVTNAWDVTSDLTAGSSSTFEYYAASNPFKATLVTLAVKCPPAVEAPVANFTATPTTGTTPLTVQFTDASTNIPTGWSWSFGDSDSTNATMQNPVHTYASAGTYTVSLTATNAGGSNTATQTDYITVNAAPQLPDLQVVNVVPNPGGAAGGYIFEREPNNIKVVVANNGPADAPSSVLVVNSSDGFSATVNVTALTAGAQKQLLVVDTSVRATVGSGLVTYNTMLDPDNLIAESNEANNAATWDTPLVWNGYKGKALYRDGGLNSTTYETYDIHGGIVNSFGNSYYRSGSYGGGWNEFDVTWNGTQPYVPAGATVKEARLYLPYTWDNSNMMPTNVTVKFDGSDITSTYQHWYWDRGNFGEWGPFTYGLLAYNVTSLYQKDGTNWVNFTRPGDPNTKLSLYGMTLAIVYEDQNISRKQIFLNEGFDLLGADPVAYATNESEATAYLEFTGPAIDTANAVRVNLITFVPSGEGPEGNLFVNGQEVAANVWNYGALNQPVGENGLPQVAVDSRDVKSYLAAEDNVIGIQSTQRAGGQPCMVAAQAFLVADYGPVAQFTNATPLSGSAPLSVTFADQSIGATGWLWDFGDGSNSTEENPTHTYNAAGTYSVKLTVTGAAGSDYTEMPNYVTVSTGVIALPGQANLPTDPDEDGMYEDLNGDGEIAFPDLQLYFVQMDWIVAHEPVSVFDYSRNGEIDFPDLQLLFAKI